MKDSRQDHSIPLELAAEYDDYVDDAIALAAGTLSAEQSDAVRERMLKDANYKAVIDSILLAESAPALPQARVDASLRSFWEQASVVGEIAGESAAALEDFAERTRVREHVWRRRLLKVGAVAATIAALTIGSWFYFDSFFTEHRTAPYMTATLELPDRSTVVLEPSSMLRHLDNMQSGRGFLRRDVYLTGSAEFTVRHIGDVRFSVTSSNAVIVAIGTRFHVQTREALTVVRVDEGQVTVQPYDENGDTQGEAVTVIAGATARVIGTKVMIDTPTGARTP